LITVAAFVAAETELKPTVGRKVVEIGGELDERHEKLLWENYRINETHHLAPEKLGSGDDE